MKGDESCLCSTVLNAVLRVFTEMDRGIFLTAVLCNGIYAVTVATASLSRVNLYNKNTKAK
jgi:hypothetical protein